MKLCPKCNRNYSDPNLEFCLEDGTKLTTGTDAKISVQTKVLPATEILPNFNQQIHNNSTIEQAKTTKVQELKEKAVDQGYKVLEISPIVAALIHNYWQWLYVDKNDFSTIGDFLLSGNFILWLVLLIIGVGLSLSTLKFGRNKGFAITSLIILAINIILFIVPRR